MKMLIAAILVGVSFSAHAIQDCANTVGYGTCYKSNLGVGGSVYQNGSQTMRQSPSLGSPNGYRYDYQQPRYNQGGYGSNIPEAQRQYFN